MSDLKLYCPTCGFENPSGAGFCQRCGVLMTVGPAGEIREIRVSGESHEEVSRVARDLVTSTVPEHKSGRVFPYWAPAAAMTFGGATLVFLMTLVVAAVIGRPVPPGSEFLVVSVIALGVALSTAFLGGDAAAKGHLPIPGVDQHPVEFSAAGGIAAFIIVLLLGSWLFPRSAPAQAGLGRTVSFDTFWIWAGYHNGHVFTEGSFAPVVYRPTSPERGDIVPENGDVLRVGKKPLRVMIANYKTQGEAQIMESPALVHGDIYVHADTGKKIGEGRLLLVRDVKLSHTRGKSYADNAVWCRVAECDVGIPACERAELELR